MLLLYLRIFSIDKLMRYLILGGIFLQVLFYTAFTACAIALEGLCTSTSATTNSFCVNNYKVVYLASIFGILSDVYVLILPIPPVMQLQFSSRRKLGVLLIFMTGIL